MLFKVHVVRLVEELIELVLVLRAHRVDPEWGALDHVVDEDDRVGLIVLPKDLESADTCGIADRAVLEASDLVTCRIDEVEELHIDLNVMSWSLLLAADYTRHRPLVAVRRQGGSDRFARGRCGRREARS